MLQETYSTLLEACVLNNRKEMAEQVYQEMRSRGLSPDSYARSALISMYGATSEVSCKRAVTCKSGSLACFLDLWLVC